MNRPTPEQLKEAMDVGEGRCEHKDSIRLDHFEFSAKTLAAEVRALQAEILSFKDQNERIAEMRIADCGRAESAEAKLSKAEEENRELKNKLPASLLEQQKCGHNGYWIGFYGNCMYCRAEKAEERLRAAQKALTPFAKAHEKHTQGQVTMHDFRMAYDALTNGEEEK